MKHGSYFYLIPSGVVDSDVSDGAKLTYAIVLGLSDRYGYCFATNEALAVMRNTSESSLKRHIKELIDNKLIEAEYSRRNDRRLTPKVFASNNEKNAKNGQIMRYMTWDDDTEDALDRVWKKIR